MCVCVCIIPYGKTESSDRDKGVWLTSHSARRLRLITDVTRTCRVIKCVCVHGPTGVKDTVFPEQHGSDTAKAVLKNTKGSAELSLITGLICENVCHFSYQ